MNEKKPLKLSDTEIQFINRSLKDLFGIDTITSLPIFRIVWVDDQFENRMSKFTPSGMELLQEEMMTLPKYHNYPEHTYMLERLVLVPDINSDELGGIKLSYEPLWNHEVGQHPQLEGLKFIINTVLAAQVEAKMMLDPEYRKERPIARYKDHPDGNTHEESIEIRKKRIDKLQDEIFGDSSGLLGATLNESGPTIIVPTSYESKKVD